MNILFIRHAEAVERSKWPGGDMGRPLTKRGRTDAMRCFALLQKAGIQAGLAVTSEAARARQTAEIFCRKNKARLHVSHLLNPGADENNIRKLLHAHRNKETIAVIGHEPDFSTIIAKLIGGKNARIILGKGACALVTLDQKNAGELRWLLPPFPRVGKKGGPKFQRLEKP